jgi:hypothetical protein
MVIQKLIFKTYNYKTLIAMDGGIIKKVSNIRQRPATMSSLAVRSSLLSI